VPERVHNNGSPDRVPRPWALDPSCRTPSRTAAVTEIPPHGFPIPGKPQKKLNRNSRRFTALAALTVSVVFAWDRAECAPKKLAKVRKIPMTAELRVWDAYGVPVRSVAFNASGTVLASATSRSVLLTEYPSGTELRTLVERDGWITAAAFAPGDKTLVTVEGRVRTGDGAESTPKETEGVIRRWSVETGRCFYGKRSGHRIGRVLAMAMSPDGTLLASGGYDGTVCLWSAASGEEIASYSIPGKSLVRRATFSPEGSRFASADMAGRVILWEPKKGKARHVWEFPGALRILGFTPDGETLVTANADGSASLFSIPPPDECRVFGLDTPGPAGTDACGPTWNPRSFSGSGESRGTALPETSSFPPSEAARGPTDRSFGSVPIGRCYPRSVPTGTIRSLGPTRWPKIPERETFYSSRTTPVHSGVFHRAGSCICVPLLTGDRPA